jgi:hypothetical protein
MSQQDYAAAIERIKASQGFTPSVPNGPAKPTMGDVPTGYANLLNTYKAQQDSEDAILNAFERAHKTNPDEYARLKKRALDAGLTIEQVEQFPAEAERRAIQDSTQRMVRNNPTLSKWLAAPGNAELGKDDTDNMGAMESALRWVKDRGRALASSVPAANAGLWGVARAGADVASEYVGKPLAGTILPEDPFARMAEAAKRGQQGADAYTKQWMPKSEGTVMRGLDAGLQSLGTNLLTLPAAVMTGNPAMALTPMAGITGGQAYGQARDKNIGVANSLSFATSQAAIEYLTEKLPVTKLLGDLKAGTGFWKTLGNAVVREVPGEQAATLLQDLNEWAVINPEKPFKSYLEERPSAAAETLIATIVGTGGQVTLLKGAQAVSDAMQRKVENAEQGARAVEQLHQLAAANKVLQRDPDALEAFINEAAANEDGSGNYVFINAAALAQSGLAQQVAQASPSVAESFEEKWQTGGDIAVPVGEYVTKIGSQPYAQQLLDHIKVDPDGFTRTEAAEHVQKHAEQQRVEVERILGEKQVDDEFKASAVRVRDAVLENLNAANRFKPAVNEAYATLESAYNAVRAADMGITPEEFFTKHRLTVMAEPLADIAGAAYDQRKGGPRDDYTLDLFGQPTTQPAPAQPAGTGVPGNVQPAPALYRDDSPGEFATRTQLVTETKRTIGTELVNTPEDAAQAMAYLARGAVERFDALVTDANGKPLAVVGSFKGAIAQTAVYPETLIGEASRIPGAANIWFAHNHPSGVETLSQADRNLSATLAKMFEGSEIKPRGLFAIGQPDGEGRRWTMVPADGSQDSVGATRAVTSPMDVPVPERVFASESKLGEAITSPDQAKKVINAVAKGRDGIVLLDSQNVPTGFLPLATLPTGNLRGTGGMDAMYRAISTGNPGAVMFADAGNFAEADIRNMAGLFNSLGVRVLDVIDTVNQQSWAGTGKDSGLMGRTFKQSGAFDGPETGSTPIGEATEIEVDGVMRPALNSNGKPIHPTQEGVRNFWKWFGDSKVVDEQDRPLVVYHGTAGDFTEFNTQGGRGKTFDTGSFFTTRAKTADTYTGGVGGSVMPVYLRISAPVEIDAAGANWNALGKKVKIATPAVEASDQADEDLLAELEGREPQKGATKKVKAKNTSLGRMFANEFQYGDETFSTDDLVRWARNSGHEGVKFSNVMDRGPTGTFSTDEAREPADLWVALSPAQIKSATGNRGTFDGGDANILHQSEASPGLLIQHNLSAENLLHAQRMGGIAVPSLAVTQKDEPLTGFGEITLLGSADMADPKGYAGTKVFGADIYSPRYPRITYQTTFKQREKLRDKFVAGEKATGSPIDLDKFESEGRGALVNSPAVMWQFLKNNDIEPDVIYTDAFDENEKRGLVEAGFSKYFGQTDHQSLMNDPEFQGLVRAYLVDQYTKAGMPDLIDKMSDNPRNMSMRTAYAMKKVNAEPEPNGYATRDALRAQIRGKLEGEFDNYVSGLFESVGATEKIFTGYTNSGTRKYKAHTLENVVAMLKKELRGGEGYNYGTGSVRAKFTPEFKSLAQIRNAKDRLVSAEAFDKIKDEIDNELTSLAESFGPHHSRGREFGFLDIFTSTMADAASMGLPRALRENQFTDVPAEKVEELRAFLGKLANLPTAYFEAKILRDVSLSEFAGAVVPDNVSPAALEALAAHGIKDVRTYKAGDAADRKAKIGEFQHLFFQGQGNRGAYDPNTNIIALLKAADLSTFLHESGHFFFETDIRLAAELVGEMQAGGRDVVRPGAEKIMRDVETLLDWHGIPGTLEQKLRAWYSMDFEEKRAAHERTAESFERYLMRGEAPSLELQPYFQRFRAWLLNVYRSIKDFLVRNPEAGKLNAEVTAVFDRMLATNDEITLAEQSRSMAPLFATAQAAGWTTEEFAAYKSAGIDATNSAIEGVQAAALRDMAFIKNATARMLAKLKRRALGARLEIQAEVTREVMRKPVYQAWQFLTGELSADDKLGAQVLAEEAKAAKLAKEKELADKVTAWTDSQEAERKKLNKDAQGLALEAVPRKRNGELKKQTKKDIEDERDWITGYVNKGMDAWLAANPKPEKPKAAPRKVDTVIDPEHDSLFVAIAKLGGLSRQAAESEWGLDPATRSPQPKFGLHVLKRKDGLKLDALAELLAQDGYLPLDENGKWELTDLEEKFHAELNGAPQYSLFHAPELNNADDRAGLGANIQAVNYGRLDEAGVRDTLNLTPAMADQLVGLKMTATLGGWHPDFVAERFGFSSGEALLTALANATPPKQEIEGVTDQRMLEEHGELATPDGLERAADKAVHNDMRARVLATEANALARAAGTGEEKKILATAVKQIADRLISRASVKDILGSLLARQYGNAEVRAAKASAAAFKAGDIATAASEKRNQVVNNAAVRAANDAHDEVRDALRKMTALANRSDKKLVKTYDIDIINAVRAVLGEYGIAPRMAKKAQAYLQTLESNDPATWALVSQAIQAAEANAKPVQQLTVEEFRGLNDELDAMLHLARRMRQMEVDGNLMDRQDVEAALYNRLDELGIPDVIPGEKGAVTPGEERMAKLQTFVAAARRVESWVEAKDGSDFGPFRRYIFQPIKDAADKYRAAKGRYLKDYRALLDAIAPSLKPQIIEAPELGYSFGKDKGGSGMAEVLHAILHTGNESNKRKLLLGRGWAVETAPGVLDTSRWDGFIRRLVDDGRLTPAHFDFAQGVWDMLERMKPGAQKTHRDVFGKYFDEVAANEFVDPFGTVRRGGYVPAMVDSRVVADAELRNLVEDENKAMAYAFPTTSKGFTMARTEYNKPLLLDLRSLSQHIDKVLLFSYMEMPVRDVDGVLKRKVGQAMHRQDPSAMAGMIRPWLNRAARQQVETPIPGDKGLMRFFSVMRTRAGMAAMMGNLINTAQQITGFSLAGVKVGNRRMLSATADWIKSPRQFKDAVATASPYMAQRMEYEVGAMNDAINEILLNPSLLEKGQAWTLRHAYFMQAGVDNVMSPIIWTAAYNQHIEAGHPHKDAVRLADGVVRTTQGSTLAEDVSRFETGNAFVRMFTQFAGYFNMQANLLGTEFTKVARDMGLRKGAGRGLYVLALGFMIPALAAELVVQAFRGGPDDEDDDGETLDDWLAALFMGTVRTATAMIPVAGQAINASVNAFNSKPYDDRMASSPAVSMLETSVRAGSTIYKVLTEDEIKAQKAVRDVSTLISMTVGLPANLAARPLGYAAGWANDDIEPVDELDAARGFLTGFASYESRQ